MKNLIILITLLMLSTKGYSPSLLNIKRDREVYVSMQEYSNQQQLLRFKQDLKESLALNSYEKKYFNGLDLSNEFYEKLDSISQLLKINPEWLFKVMWSESRLNHKAKNSIGAYGLIQFLPISLKHLKTNIDKVQKLNEVEQLDLVYKYFKGANYNSIHDLYLYSFFPILVGSNDNTVISYGRLTASLVAKQNKGFDLNKDGKITIKEFKQFINKKLLNAKN